MARPVPSSPQDVDRDQNWSITLYDKGIIRFNGHRMIRVLKNKQTNKNNNNNNNNFQTYRTVRDSLSRSKIKDASDKKI